MNTYENSESELLLHDASAEEIENILNDEEIIWGYVTDINYVNAISFDLRKKIETKYPNIFELAYDYIISRDPLNLVYIPQKYRSIELCKIGIRHSVKLFRVVPTLLMKELYDLALEHGEVILSQLPMRYRTLDICKRSLLSNGMSIQFIPRKMHMTLDNEEINNIAEELYKMAVQQNGLALKYIIKYINKDYLIIKHDYFKTLFITAIQQNGLALNFVPLEYKTIELCKLAAAQNGRSIEFIPKYFLCNENIEHDDLNTLYRIAIEQNGLALLYIPKRYRTLDLCKLAINNNGESLIYVPNKYKSEELCLDALRNNIYAIRFVPDYKKTINMYILVHKQNPSLTKKYFNRSYQITKTSNVLIEDDLNTLCSICWNDEERNHIFKLADDPCKTSYCINCFNNWIKINNSCPGCREPFIIENKGIYILNTTTKQITKV